MFPIFFIIKLVILAAGGVVTYAGVKNWSWVYMLGPAKSLKKSMGADAARFSVISGGILLMLMSIWLIF